MISISCSEERKHSFKNTNVQFQQVADEWYALVTLGNTLSGDLATHMNQFFPNQV